MTIESEQGKGTHVIISFPNISHPDQEKEDSQFVVQQGE